MWIYSHARAPVLVFPPVRLGWADPLSEVRPPRAHFSPAWMHSDCWHVCLFFLSSNHVSMTSVGYCWRYESDVQDGLDELLLDSRLTWMNENPTKIIGSMFHFLELITMHVIARKRYPILISYIFIYSLSQSFFPNVVLCSWRHDFILLLKSPLTIQKK